ncbi:hypothetical protein DFH06DRAFT_1468024 [Mycena polygramma]|nr:hypothetical protein DFH06DRAFT_1468024 [Mycena polygramma]
MAFHPHRSYWPYLIGVVLNTFLWCPVQVLMIQMIIYYQAYKNDKALAALFVVYLFVVESLNTGLSIALVYQPLVGQFGTDSPTTLFPSLLPSQPFLEAAISFPVQLFYAWRISLIMRSYIASVFICMASVTSVGDRRMLDRHYRSQVKVYADKPKVDRTALVWSCSAAAADIIITTSLIWSLKLRKTGIKRTDNTVDRIVRSESPRVLADPPPDLPAASIQTGGLTVAFTILDVALFVALPTSTLSFVFDFGIPKLYSNALLSTFNARTRAKEVVVELATAAPGDTNMLFLATNEQVATSGTIVFNTMPTTTGQFTECPRIPIY